MDFTKPNGYKNISQTEIKPINNDPPTFFDKILGDIVLSISQLLDKF